MKEIRIVMLIILCLSSPKLAAAQLLDQVNEQGPSIVKTVQGDITGILTSEYMYQMYFYSVCSTSTKCASLGDFASLGLQDLPEDQQHLDPNDFIPAEESMVKVTGLWNIYSDNSVALNIDKPFEIWSKAMSVKDQQILLKRFYNNEIKF